MTIFTVGFVFFSWMAPPGLYWLDSPELTAASFGWGAPHATGFPLYTWFAKCLALVPIGEIAFRYHLVSALAGALSLVLCAKIVSRLGGNSIHAMGAGVIAAGLLLVNLTFLRQSTVAEVYVPNACMVLWALHSLLALAQGGGARAGMVLSVVCGLGLGMHTTFRLLLGVPVVMLLAYRFWRGAKWVLLAPLVALVCGLALHTYFPVRSVTGRTADIDWGHPANISALKDYVTAKSIRDGLGENIMTRELVVWQQDAKRMLQTTEESVGVVAMVLGFLGLLWLCMGKRPQGTRFFALVCALGLLGDFWFSSWAHPIGIEDLQNGVPTALLVAILAGVGIFAFLAKLGRVGLAMLFPVFLVSAGEPAMTSFSYVASGQNNELPRQFVESAWQKVPPRATLLVRSDSLAGGLLQTMVVEGARPDVLWNIRQFMPDQLGNERSFARVGLSFTPGQPAMPQYLAANRNVVWELEDDGNPPGMFHSGAILGWLTKDRPPNDELESSASIVESWLRQDGADDPLSQRMLAHWLSNLGRVAYSRNLLERAQSLFLRAIETRPLHAEAWVNLGVVLSRKNDLPKATEATLTALSIEPNRMGALINGARYQLAQSHFDEANQLASRAARIKPEHAEAWYLLGMSEVGRGRIEQAKTALKQALTINPKFSDAAQTLANLK